MTTLTDLERLAQAAITHEPSDHGKLSAVRMRVWQEALDDFHDEAHPERVLQLLACIEAAKRMRELGVEISRRCIEPPYMSEKAAINEFIGVFDGPLQRTLDAAAITELRAEVARLTTKCKYGDPMCPCQDGDACHYEGDNPMTPPPIAALKAHIAALEAERDQMRASLDRIVSAYDAYRGKGMLPAPNQYAMLVAAIDAAREKP